MDLAKNLAEWRNTPLEQWIALINRFLPPVVAVILVVLIAARAAELTWRLLEDPADQAEVPTAPPASSNGPAAPGSDELASLTGWYPFGKPPEPEAGIPASDILDADETDLPLVLHGTVVIQELPERGSTVLPEAGTAIIATGRSPEKIYQTGQTVDGSQGAKLHSVYTDRVMLDRGGGRPLEKLSYPKPDEALTQTTRSGPRSNVAAVMRNDQVPATDPGDATALTEAAAQFASTLGQYIRPTPYTEGGQVIGFRLQPSSDPEVFQQLGFEPGDVLMEVNGAQLNDARNVAQIFQTLGESNQAQVRVRRNGNDQVLVIDTGQIKRLAESRQ